MATDREKLIPYSVRLPESQIDFINLLVKNKILGGSQSIVTRLLLESAITDIKARDLVRKHFETLEQLKRGGDA